jgi:hypothetical protein
VQQPERLDALGGRHDHIGTGLLAAEAAMLAGNGAAVGEQHPGHHPGARGLDYADRVNQLTHVNPLIHESRSIFLSDQLFLRHPGHDHAGIGSGGLGEDEGEPVRFHRPDANAQRQIR